MPPGRVRNASDFSIIRFLRLAMPSVTTSSSDCVSAISRSTSDCGMTPTVCPPAARAPAATAPIMPTRPPPETSTWPRRASASPTSVGEVEPALVDVCDEAQNTQMAATAQASPPCRTTAASCSASCSAASAASASTM